MDTRLIISATAAAAFHAFVLLGFNHSHVQPPAKAKDAKVGVIPPPIVMELKDPEPPEDKSTELTPAPKGEAEQLKPQLDDPPTPVNAIFEQVTEKRRKVPVDVVSKISNVPVGEWDGIGTTASRLPGILSPDLLDDAPRARSQVSPTYPAAERNAGITGEVVVEFVVDETGRVQQPRIVRSSRTGFELATLRAVEKWRFEPGKKDGRTVKFRMIVPVQFNLDS
jgi:protein TonB